MLKSLKSGADDKSGVLPPDTLDARLQSYISVSGESYFPPLITSQDVASAPGVIYYTDTLSLSTAAIALSTQTLAMVS